MKLHHLRTFVVVFQEKSFTSAAARVYATQSGLSMQIRELEEDLGVQLFERSSRGVIPTAAGACYYERALKVLQELEEGRREMRALKGEVLGSVSVGIMPTFSRAALAPALSEFALAHPHVTLRITEAYSAVLTDGVAQEEFDFAIVPPGGADPRVESRYISRDRELFVTRSRETPAHLTPVSLRSGTPLKLVVPTSRNARRARVDEYLSSIGAPIGSMLEMDAMMGTLELIATSDWTAILPAALCHPDREGRLRNLYPIIDPPLWVDYVQIAPAARKLSPAAAAFAETLTRYIRRIAADWDALIGSSAGP